MNETIKCELNVDGMHCAACELLIEKKLSKVKGAKTIKAELNSNKVIVELNKNTDKKEFISKANEMISNDGYLVSEGKIKNKDVDLKDYVLPFVIASILTGAFILLQKANIFSPDFGTDVNYVAIFFIGVLASLSTCMAVVGGLVLTISAKYSSTLKTTPLILFHISRILSFFILGGVIGFIGSTFQQSNTVHFILNIAIFFIMVIIGFNLLQLFPELNKFQLRMPKSIGKFALDLGEANNFLMPIIAGAITFFLPCGFTQSVQFYSLTTGNALNGALTMLVFALGTFPALGLISFASAKFSRSLQSSLFFRTSGFLILAFAILNLLSSLASIGLIAPVFNF
jgi:sulfite exporter TauE/SafE/copper chaperone CopZ